VVAAEDVKNAANPRRMLISKLWKLNKKHPGKNIQPKECLVVEDSKHGLISAHAGMKVVARHHHLSRGRIERPQTRWSPSSRPFVSKTLEGLFLRDGKNAKTAREELSLLLKEKEGSMDLAGRPSPRPRRIPRAEPHALFGPNRQSLAAAGGERISVGRDPMVPLVAALNSVLFEEEDFKGNSEEYYDPRNSFLNEVLDRRVGIPITLSILYHGSGATGRHPHGGIGLPGHFIVGLVSPGRTLYVDPFHQGQTDDGERMRRTGWPKFLMVKCPHAESSGTLTSRGILFALFTNLKNIYMESRSFAKGHAVIDKMVLVRAGRMGPRARPGIGTLSFETLPTGPGRFGTVFTKRRRHPGPGRYFKIRKIDHERNESVTT
jgi:hypothetical protein